jgi:hypothetical protein
MSLTKFHASFGGFDHWIWLKQLSQIFEYVGWAILGASTNQVFSGRDSS